jgi:hypothetical protein
VTTAESSLGSGSFAAIRIPIEGYRTSKLGFGAVGALPVTIGVWTKAHRTGTYAMAVLSFAGGSRSFTTTFTVNVADTWEFKTVIIPGDVAGTWVGHSNAAALNAYITIAAGSGFATAANAWSAGGTPGVTGQTNGVAATSDVFQVGPCGILSGAYSLQSLQMQRILRPYNFDGELLKSKRYWQSTYNHGVLPGTVTTAGARFRFPDATTSFADMGIWQFIPEMMSTPTVTIYSPATGATGKIDDQGTDRNGATANAGYKGVGIYVNNVSVAQSHGLNVHAVANSRM